MPNIRTDKVEESKRFYTELIGLNLVMNLDWILMFASPSNETAQVSILKGDKFKSNDGFSITIEVENVDEMHEKVLAQGIKPTYALTTEKYGVRRFHILDPNGIIINIMSHLL